jgi:hypothetical protein
VRLGGILAILYRSDGRGSANFRDLYASRLISVAADCRDERGHKRCFHVADVSRILHTVSGGHVKENYENLPL